MRLILVVFALWLAWGGHAIASSKSHYVFPQGEVTLIDNGQSLGLYFQLAEHWHLYWRNSGDSGAAPWWRWTINGANLSDTHWPVPERIPVEGLINFGYESEVLYEFDLVPQDGAKHIDASVEMEFLVCKVECIPYVTTLSRTVRVDESTTGQTDLFNRFLFPEATPSSIQWIIQDVGQSVLDTRLTLPATSADSLRNLRIFPVSGADFQAKAPAVTVLDDSQYGIQLALQDTQRQGFTGAQFLLVLEFTDGQRQAYNIALEQPPATPFVIILMWAMLGGLILNLMPCVFPVLSIKIMSFMGPDREARTLRLSGWLYSAGVILSFILLGGVLLALRAAGEGIGWGFQLQNPWFVAGLAILFCWLAMNFLGFFEIGLSLTRLGEGTRTSGYWGSFLTGVLATIVATPCTAPFMGAALGASLTLPAAYTLVVFAGLGLGMALPFLILAHAPGTLKRLPKPGLWLSRFKEFLAFPLLATSLWLLWVLSFQVQAESVLLIVGVFILIGFWIWLARGFKDQRLQQGILIIGFLLSIFSPILMERKHDAAVRSEAESTAWMTYSQSAVELERKQGKPVFIDFTAAWCITCQVNKKVALNKPAVEQAFERFGVQRFRADWTNKDPTITRALKSYGRNSLPLYVYYAPGSDEPRILPEVLTPGIVVEALKQEKNQ